MARLRFRQQRRPRNYLARREQWRLLLIVLTLGLVVILYAESRDPGHFGWIDALRQRPGDPADRRAEPRRAEPKPDQEIPGAFVSPLTDSPAPDSQAHRDHLKRAAELPRVNADHLAAIRDDTPFRKAEADAWFQLLEVLRTTPVDALRAASIGRVTYIQLAQQPGAYRGELVTLLGTVRRAHRVAAPENEYGIQQYYQLWLQPEDSPDDPIVVYSLFVPEGFPIGMDVSADARITGFFFKRWSYLAQDQLRSAPAVLSRTVDWLRQPAGPQRAQRDPSIWFVLGISAALAMLGVVYVYFRTRGEKRPVAEAVEMPELPGQ